MSKKFKDDVIQVVEADVDKIRTRPSMYIGSIGESGILHICKELIANNIDECIKTDSPADTIYIEFDNSSVMAMDNGRGIPSDLLQIVHETNQAGSNFTRETDAMTAGENGTGTCCITALTSDFVVTTTRPQENKKLTLHYQEGKLVDKIEEKYTGDEHGLMSKFYPSKQMFGTNRIPVDKLLAWLKDFDYTLPEGINMSYKYKNKLMKVEHKPIEHKILTRVKDNTLSELLKVEFEGDVKELYKDKTYDKKFSVEACLMYASPDYKDIPVKESWMNMIYTTLHGGHVDGVMKGYSKYITEKCYKRKPILEGENLKRDIENHLQIVVKCNCNLINVFKAQEKTYVNIDPPNLMDRIAEEMYKKLESMPQAVINDFADVVIANNRARKAGEEARNIKSVTKKDKWEKPDTFIPCSNEKTIEPKELFLCEGNSAAGGIRAGRFPKYQAILMFQGKSLNVWDVTLERTLQSKPWLNLVKILGCGIGATFNINKLNFDKIFITTDADIDGYHIRVQMCSMFLKYFPEIIAAGKLYIAEPPLYQLARGKDKIYVASQGEYIEECIKSVGACETTFMESKNYKNTPAGTFITEAFDYLTRLEECGIKRSVDMFLLEFVANAFVKYGESVEAFKKNFDKWGRSIVDIYPEIGFDHKTNQLYATIDLRDHLLLIDDELIESLRYVIDIQKKYGLIVSYVTPSREGSSTLGRFLSIIQSVYPKIKDRYKGLGQSPKEVMRSVVMDPKTRRAFRVTAQDIDVMKRMSNLVGDKKNDIINRKEMLMNFHITSDMLDN